MYVKGKLMNTAFEQVLAKPYPTLDQKTPINPTGSEQQYHIYQEVLQILQPSLEQAPLVTNFHTPITVTVIPAGAGSGKSRTLISLSIALLRLGESANHIHSLSFTNASANELRGKLIAESVNFLRYEQIQNNESNFKESHFKANNINCGTIHKHALDMLKQLEPHVGGVGYYFEDANQSTPVIPSDGYESEEAKSTKKSLLLSLFTSIYFHQKNNPYGKQLAQALSKFIQDDARFSHNRFIVKGLADFDLLNEADRFIKEESLSDAGLGAFTNIDNTDPNYAIAVATDALLRLWLAKDSFEQADKYQILGLPKYLMVDEAQDIDMIQILYLRALALNGTHLIMVGDPRQTLYEFRHALSEWGFDPEFLTALFIYTDIETRITKHALTTNYRSRAEILKLAEMVSQRMVDYSHHERPADAKYIEEIHDPEESVRPNECFIAPNDMDKTLPAVSVIIGDVSEHNDWLVSKLIPKKTVENKPITALPKAVGLQRFQQQLDKNKSANQAENDAQLSNAPFLNLVCKDFQLPSKCGGKHQADIERLFCTLYDKCEQGDTVGILLRKNPTPEDKNFLKNLIQSHKPQAFDPLATPKVTVEQTGNERTAPLDNYYFFSEQLTQQYGTPFTSLMIASAIHYFFSWDKMVKVEFQKLASLKEINAVYPAQTLEKAQQNNPLDLESIKLELVPFFDAVLLHRETLLPNTSVAKLEEHQSALLTIFAEFIKSVLHNYAMLLWSKSEVKPYKQQPCRFQGCAVQFDKDTHEPMIRHLSETKRLFKLMWQAISKTTFHLKHEQRTLLKSLNISNEWLAPDINLINFAQMLAEFRDKPDNTANEEILNKCIKQRERIHEQFSKLYHRKTRTYLREIAKHVGYEVRHNLSDNVPEKAILRAVYPHYMDARNLALTNTWFKGDGTNRRSYGLFNDMLVGIREIDIQSKPKSKRNLADDSDTQKHEFTFSTIHASKGLEWEHVVLVLPKATGNDTSTSFKSARDLLYVAMTRAKKTLTIFIEKEKNQRISANDTCFKVANRLIHDCTKQLDWYNRKLHFGECEILDKSEKLKPIVCDETSHSELEKASTCQIHHYIQHNRTLSTMNPLASPSYAFFFHSTLSSLCASLVGQRISMADDPINEMADYIRHIAQRSNLEGKLDYATLSAELVEVLQASCNSVMQTMIPMYYLVGEARFVALIDYYSLNFLQQLASILVGSQLFANLLVASRLPNHRILIEKSVRALEKMPKDEIYLPIYGVPDIAIIGDKVNYIADYKTLVTQVDDDTPLDKQTLSQISQKTAQQITFYQGILQQSQLQTQSQSPAFVSEVIYVADLTVQEQDDIPKIPPKLPLLSDSVTFTRNAQPSAIILTSRSFNTTEYQTTLKDIDTLRYHTENYDEVIPSELFEPCPLPKLTVTAEVTADTCRTCGSRIHCQQTKSMNIAL